MEQIGDKRPTPSNLCTAMSARLLALCLLSCLLPCLSGCSSTPGANWISSPPLVLTTLGAAGVNDVRLRFRSVFCQINQRIGAAFPDARPCDQSLVISSQEVADSSKGDLPPRQATPRTLVFVSGLFGECVRTFASPFADSYERLKSQGFRILIAPVEGRSSSRRNATLLDAYLNEQIGMGEDFILIGHSKGVVDTLEAIHGYGQAHWVRQMKALVSVAGAVMGSSIADDYERVYALLAAHLPFPGCGPGDGGGLASITRIERAIAMHRIRLPAGLPLFSLAAVPTPDQVNPVLEPFYSKLSQIDPRNDGQLLAQDAILPASIFLGYVNADHWSIALPFNRSASPMAQAFAGNNAFPREVLIESLLSIVEEHLAPGLRQAR